MGDSTELQELSSQIKKPIISLDNIHKTYLLGIEGVPALRGVSVDIYPGEFIVVYGTSGGGKTTLLNIIGTIDTPSKGELVVDGNRINSSTEDSVMAELRLKTLWVFMSSLVLCFMPLNKMPVWIEAGDHL
eukprot:TRINITY_DN1061_c0_g1_i3.p3 TRINITY_DN1061_c0_g1~~TRINITY_DN1061_c0_g1_i3.p3  ORF type:complete len:131 (+),score=27.16 TRINITY_DN1061_c0_g1_i3:45-437(+)